MVDAPEIYEVTVTFTDGKQLVLDKKTVESLLAIKNVVDVMGEVGLISIKTKGLLQKK
jgi:hypothetical protein